MKNLFTYLRNVRTESKKVTWPTRKETFSTFFLVITVVIISALFFALVDYLSLEFVQAALLGA